MSVAEIAQLKANYEQLASVVQEILDNRKDYSTGIAVKYNNPSVEVGDFVYGNRVSTINSGDFFFAQVLSIPVTSDSDLEFNIEL